MIKRFMFVLVAFCVAPRAVQATPYHDYVTITSDAPIVGPGGIHTSCLDIADLGSDLPGSDEGLLYDSLGNKTQSYAKTQGLFGVPFVKWTPSIVGFLKRTVDQCANNATSLRGLFERLSKNGTGVSMSPTKAKKTIDAIYAIAVATNKANAEFAEERRREQAEKRAQRRKLVEHIEKLRSGAVKVASIDDAIYYYSAKPLRPLISSPLLNPDKQYYAGAVILDGKQGANVLRAKIENYVDMTPPPRFVPLAYVFLKEDKKTVVYNADSMRLENTVRVVGKYVANVQYQTVSGEIETAPVLQVLYLGN